MLLIRCPYCEMERPELEFAYAGEAHIARPADPRRFPMKNGAISCSPAPTRAARIMNAGGNIHGCGRFFNAVRDTVSDKFVVTYKAGKPRPVLEQTPAAETK